MLHQVLQSWGCQLRTLRRTVMIQCVEEDRRGMVKVWFLGRKMDEFMNMEEVVDMGEGRFSGTIQFKAQVLDTRGGVDKTIMVVMVVGTRWLIEKGIKLVNLQRCVMNRWTRVLGRKELVQEKSMYLLLALCLKYRKGGLKGG
ncbi:unnamed protein product [Linum trigynum]|uniref:Uncharacterized protein n=1 Tax=Linum trigynum TaxID=586398 RepID=A0AAV2FY08_9ROSI